MRKDLARLYNYVGSNEIKLGVSGFSIGKKIQLISDLEEWIRQTNLEEDTWGLMPATFVVDSVGDLRLADRHSEHIACAGGEPVLSAGEMFFTYGSKGLEVAEVTNQSTGFCPEPESWFAVAKALDRIGIAHSGRFTTEVVFRRCFFCTQVNLVKENLFLCAVCGTSLPLVWNLDC